MKCKPKVHRGNKCGSINSGYIIIGVHPDRTSVGNREYIFCDKGSDNEKAELKKTTVHIIKQLESSVTSLSSLYKTSAMLWVRLGGGLH